MSANASINNYQSLVSKFGIPDKLKPTHNEFITEVMANDWIAYRTDKTIAETVDLYLQKYTQLVNAEEASKPQQPKPTVVKEPMAKPTAKVVKEPKKEAKPKKVKPKPAVVKEPKKPAQPKPRKVADLNPAVKFIRDFIELEGISVKKQKFEALLHDLQEAIITKKIRKTSPYAEHIENIQRTLISICNSSHNEATIEIEPAEMAKLAIIAGGQEVYPSIKIVKKYLAFQGQEISKYTVQGLLDKVVKALSDKNSVRKNDPFFAKLNEIKVELEKLINKAKTPFILLHNSYALRGLEGLNGIEEEFSGLGEIEGTNPKIMTASQIMASNYPKIGLFGKWKDFLGDIGRGAAIMAYGLPGNGKSTLALKFAKYLSTLGNVIFVSAEEFGTDTLKEKIRQEGGVGNVHFAKNLEDINPADYEFLFIDSVQAANFSIENFRALKARYPKLTIFLVMQVTKDGIFKGSNEWSHDVDTVIEVVSGIAYTRKNRYNQLSQMLVFPTK